MPGVSFNRNLLPSNGSYGVATVTDEKPTRLETTMDIAAYEAHYAAERHAMRVEQDKQGREEMRASADRTLNGVRSW